MPEISSELSERALAEVAAWAARAHGLSPDRAFCEKAFEIATAAAVKVLRSAAEPVTKCAVSPCLAAFAAEMAAQKMAMAQAIAKSSLSGIGLSDRTISELLIALKEG